jgi:aconitate hydratase
MSIKRKGILMSKKFDCKKTIQLGNEACTIYSLPALHEDEKLTGLPFSIKILLENLLRTQDEESVTAHDIETLLNIDLRAEPVDEIAFTPSRVILQDFTGVPAIVDLATMREAMKNLGGDPNKINPLSPVDLVIDHSVMVDHYGSKNSFNDNTRIEFERNGERYSFLRWGQESFSDFKVVPPGTGIVHQVNLEYLATVVFSAHKNGETLCYPDTLVGTDSHTTMINGLGVLGWGVGGIEAEAAMLGQPVTMLIPQVIGFKLTGNLKSGTTATDLVLTVVEMLRKKGVVGKFVEFFGDGLDHLPVADRATIANMAPEYGATCGIFPIDNETLKYLRLSGRDEKLIAKIEAYYRHQGMFRASGAKPANYTDILELDLGTVVPCIAGPKRPQDRIELTNAKQAFGKVMQEQHKDATQGVAVQFNAQQFNLKNGDVVIAAITSCTNTSNPSVMIAAGLVAQKAVALGLTTKPWVKTSLAPGSKVVTSYLNDSKLYESLEKLGFNLVGYGCTTCIGNSGPLAEPIAKAINENDLSVAAVLSGNRNFEGRIHPQVKNAYLASPPLVVVYALAGTMNIDLMHEPIGKNKNGQDVFMRDIWPNANEIQEFVAKSVTSAGFIDKYRSVFEGNNDWKGIKTSKSNTFNWQNDSTYVKKAPFFDGMTKELPKINNIKDAYVLVKLEDSVTTDHISPAGSIEEKSPAGEYLKQHQVSKADFNSYGSRRGNHEVMMRGTFANIRLKNLLVAGKEGGYTVHFPSNKQMSIYEASMLYQQEQHDLIIIAGKEYGSGSSRDWAAKGPKLLGVKTVIAESFERIHRSNLIGMGILPLQFKPGTSANSLGLDGTELYSLQLDNLAPKKVLSVVAKKANHSEIKFEVIVRIDTPKELIYFQHGGILNYVLRQLIRS